MQSFSEDIMKREGKIRRTSSIFMLAYGQDRRGNEVQNQKEQSVSVTVFSRLHCFQAYIVELSTQFHNYELIDQAFPTKV